MKSILAFFEAFFSFQSGAFTEWNRVQETHRRHDVASKLMRVV